MALDVWEDALGNALQWGLIGHQGVDVLCFDGADRPMQATLGQGSPEFRVDAVPSVCEHPIPY